MKHDKSSHDLEKKDVNMPGSTGSQNPSSGRRDDLESSEVGASSRSGSSGSQSGSSGSSRTGSSSSSSSSSDLGSPSRSSSSSSDFDKDR